MSDECINCHRCLKEICPGDKCYVSAKQDAYGELYEAVIFCDVICYGKDLIEQFLKSLGVGQNINSN